MGADIQQNSYRGRNNSWAVVCFKRGNNNIVKFIDLDVDGRNGRNMYEYLRQFDASRYMIDSPFSQGISRDLFYMWKGDNNE